MLMTSLSLTFRFSGRIILNASSVGIKGTFGLKEVLGSELRLPWEIFFSYSIDRLPKTLLADKPAASETKWSKIILQC